MAYINIIAPSQAEGELKDIYDSLEKSRGKVAEVIQLHSLNPQSMMDHVNFYMTIMFSKSPLKRYQREMLAVIVSVYNNCEYCQIHHAAALNNFWKDENRIEQLKTDYKKAGLNVLDVALVEYAMQLTKNPSESDNKSIDLLREKGLDDRAILDANMIISYFNFVNRMVLGLGAQVEEDKGVGYKYD